MTTEDDIIEAVRFGRNCLGCGILIVIAVIALAGFLLGRAAA